MQELNHKQMLFEALRPEVTPEPVKAVPEVVRNVYQEQARNWKQAEAALEELIANSFDEDGFRKYRIPNVEGFWVASDVLSDANLIELLINHGSAVDKLLVDVLKGIKPLENLEKIRDLLGARLLESAEDKWR
jgi:hypothetical protein